MYRFDLCHLRVATLDICIRTLPCSVLVFDKVVELFCGGSDKVGNKN